MTYYCNACLKENVNGFCGSCEKKLFDRSKVPPVLNFNWSDIQDKLTGTPGLFSISGVQAKGFIGRHKNKLLSPNRNIESMYIIKPVLDSRRNRYSDSPANEHLTMTIADKIFGIPVALNAYMIFSNGDPCYITRRFDRNSNGDKFRQEDFVSVLEAQNRNKYFKYTSFSYEDIGNKLNPIDRIRFIKTLIFNFLIGNGDAHLKNFSLLESKDRDMILSPAYDLMNTKLHIEDQDIAMNLFREKERPFNRFFSEKHTYTILDFKELGDRLKINYVVLEKMIARFKISQKIINDYIGRSFLSREGKLKYKTVVSDQYLKLFSS